MKSAAHPIWSMALGLAFTLAASVCFEASAAVARVICVPWQGDPYKYHTAISGQQVRLRAVIRADSGSQIWYKWVFGDGTESPVGALSGRTSYDVEVDHVYRGAVGTPFTARLLADSVDGSMANTVSDPYFIKLEEPGLDARVNIAIDNGLWLIHKSRSAYSRFYSYASLPIIAWHDTGYEWYAGSPTASAIQAFQINGHKQTGNPDEDPYVLNVRHGFNFLFTGYIDDVNHPILRPLGMSLQGGANPDSNGNGVGIEVRDWGYRPIYQGGMVMDAIIASGTPGADSGRDFNGDGVNDTYQQVLQDMCDMYAWGQCDAADGRGGIAGGWRYSWNDWPDNSAAQWAAIGMIPAQEAPWNCIVPDWVKVRNNSWLHASFASYSGGIHGGFGYTGSGWGTALTPCGMVQLSFVGATRDDARWKTSERWIDDNWKWWLEQDYLYADYAFAKAMRLARPTPVTTLSPSGMDWYRGGMGRQGLADRIASRLISQHYWTASWMQPGFATSWAVIILRPVLFQEAPVACFNAVPNPTYPLTDVEFDPSCSGHSDPAKGIANLVLFEWDWNGDGTYEEASTGPGLHVRQFECPSVPCIYPVTLRVTDDVGNTATYRQDVRITDPPHPPVARLSGPYMLSLCDLDQLEIDASGSFDPDQGNREAGCPSCPADGIIAWDWDLNGAPWTYPGPAGAIVNLGRDWHQYFQSTGSYDIGVRVTDNTAAAYPRSGQPNLTHEAFTQVDVYEEGPCDVKVALSCREAFISWDDTGAVKYSVMRSSDGPNIGFRAVAETTATSFLLPDLPLGVRRWIRIAAVHADRTTLSQAVEILADAEACVPIANPGGPYEACVGRPLKLSGLGSVARLGSIVAWDWDLDGDGIYDDASGAQPSYTWHEAGSFPIGLRVRSDGFTVLTGEAHTTVTVVACECLASFSARAKLNKVQLTWTPEPDAESYNVYRSTTPWFELDPAHRLAEGVVSTYSTYLDSSCTSGVTYFYRIAKLVGGVEVCVSPREVHATPMERGAQLPPIANAGPDQIVSVGHEVRLDGSQSFDPNGSRILFRWRLLSRPGASGAALTGPRAVRPTFVADHKGVYVVELIVNDGALDSAPDTVRIATENSPPNADPGVPQNVPVGTRVNLDASKSTDPDGDALTFRWLLVRRPEKSNATVADPAAVTTSLLVDAAGTYEIELIANDGIADSEPALFVINTLNSPPIAKVEADRAVAVGRRVALDGSQSSDIDGDALTFQWSLTARPPGSLVDLDGAAQPEAWFTPDVPGRYLVQLVVSDGQESSVAAIMEVLANAGPIAHAGDDQTTRVGRTVELDGTGSTDPEGDALAYEWLRVAAPEGSGAHLSDPKSARPVFVPDRKGEYGFELKVSDGLTTSAPDTVRVIVENTPPTADAGPDLFVDPGQWVALSGTASSDVDGDALTYTWRWISTPPSSAAVLQEPLTATPHFIADAAGEYRLELVVHDGIAGSAPDKVLVRTRNRVPTAEAGPGQAHFVGELVSLDGSASVDPDGDALNFTWSIASAPEGSGAGLDASDLPNPTLVPDLEGTYVLRLVVSDGQLQSMPDDVVVTAKPFRMVPSVQGMTEQEAIQAITGLGLVVGNVQRRSDPDVPAGLVIEAVPSPGGKVDPGSTVNLVVSSGPDTGAPQVVVRASPTHVPVGGSVTLTVEATDDGIVQSLALVVNGTPLSLVNGSASFVCVTVGAYTARATAIDAAGNEGVGETTFYAVDPSDTTPPTAAITAPVDDATVTAPTDIIGSAFDPAGQFAFYTVEIAPIDQVNLDTLESASFREIARSTAEVRDGKLATFDPTMLRNDAYVVRLTGWDQNGQGDRRATIVNVLGDLKFGEFRLAFTDLTIPLAGIPITVSRIYDTRDAFRRGDFGQGWSMGVREGSIFKTLRDGGMYVGSRVYIAGPSGRRDGYSVSYVPSSPLFAWLGTVILIPDAGVHDKLEILGNAAMYVDGRLMEVLSADGFDPANFRLTTKDGTIYTYHDRDGLESIVDPNGNRLEYRRDGIFHYPSGASEPDQSIPFIRDDTGRIVEITDPAGKPLRYVYDTAGDLRSFTDQEGNVTSYVYDAERAHYLDHIVDFAGRVAVRAVYDDAGRFVALVDASGNTVEQSFDSETNVGTFTDARGNQTILHYDERGNETARIVPGISTNLFVYDGNNNLARGVNARGGETNMVYDARGNVTLITDPSGATTQIAYNDLNKPVRVVNALGQVLSMEYDGAGNLLSVINNGGHRTSMTRDSQGRVTSTTDAEGNTTQFDYAGGCPCGRPGKVINPDGSFRLYGYTPEGLTNRVVSELGAETRFNYDGVGRLLSTRDPMGNETRYFYHGPLLTNIVDALGRSTRFEYDAQNRTNKIIDAEGGVVEFRYDANGNRTHVIDPVGNVTEFVYDAANRVVREINPLSHSRYFAYDGEGNRIEAIDRNGRRRTFAYDAMNRMTNEVWWEGETIVSSIEFGFNELGVQTRASDPAATYTYSYDSLNRLASVAMVSAGQPDFTLNYTYTALGQVKTVTDNWGVQVGSGYDNRGRLATRTWSGAVDEARVDFSYAADGNRMQIERFADLAGLNRIGRTTNAYNHAGIITNITHLGPAAQTLAKYEYGLDAAWQITQWTINGQPSTYTYDRTGQLTDAINTAQPNETFRYDANGNRVGAQSSGNYVVGRNNQILSDGTFEYGYDLEGNMTSRRNVATGATTQYQFDHRNRLVAVTDRDGESEITQSVALRYDVANRRLIKAVNDATQRFLYNQHDSWADLAEAGSVAARYLYGPNIDEILARQGLAAADAWFLSDHLGTIRDAVDSGGDVINHFVLSSFGLIVDESSPVSSDRFLMGGRELDRETGLLFLRARFYSPALGRFLSEDPLGLEPPLWNLFAYVANSPHSGTDPFGESLLEYTIARIRNVAEKVAVECFGKKALIDVATTGVYIWVSDMIPYVGKSWASVDNRVEYNKFKAGVYEAVRVSTRGGLSHREMLAFEKYMLRRIELEFGITHNVVKNPIRSVNMVCEGGEFLLETVLP